jgi:hypothetical protein
MKQPEFLDKSEYVSHTDYNRIFDNKMVDEMQVEEINAGDLNLVTGKIVACDPIIEPDLPPFKNTVKPGLYPVKLYTVSDEEHGEIIAITKVEFSKEKAIKWLLALREGESLKELKKKGDYFGFASESGLCGIYDYKTSMEFNSMTDNFLKNNPEKNMYDEFFSSEFKKNAKDQDDPDDSGEWASYIIPETDHNLVMMGSGYGEGLYPAYWGMTEENKIVSLVIDYFVLLVPEGKENL